MCMTTQHAEDKPGVGSDSGMPSGKHYRMLTSSHRSVKETSHMADRQEKTREETAMCHVFHCSKIIF